MTENFLQVPNCVSAKDKVSRSKKNKKTGQVFNDGYKWHKYGQKTLMENTLIRSYYRCSNKATCCQAKKSIDHIITEKKDIATYFFQHNHPPPSKRIRSLLRKNSKSKTAKSLKLPSSPPLSASLPSSSPSLASSLPSPSSPLVSSPSSLPSPSPFLPSPSKLEVPMMLSSSRLTPECRSDDLSKHSPTGVYNLDANKVKQESPRTFFTTYFEATAGTPDEHCCSRNSGEVQINERENNASPVIDQNGGWGNLQGEKSWNKCTESIHNPDEQSKGHTTVFSFCNGVNTMTNSCANCINQSCAIHSSPNYLNASYNSMARSNTYEDILSFLGGRSTLSVFDFMESECVI